MIKVELNRGWLIEASKEVRMKEVRLRTRMIRFQEMDERQSWGWGHITNHITQIIWPWYCISHITIILHKSNDHDITPINKIVNK